MNIKIEKVYGKYRAYEESYPAMYIESEDLEVLQSRIPQFIQLLRETFPDKWE